jgi:hypothetical protein
MLMRDKLGKPIPSPVVLGQVSEKFRVAVEIQAEQQQIPIHQFAHKERKDDVANYFRQRRGVRDQVVVIGVAQERAQAWNGRKVNGQLNSPAIRRFTSTIIIPTLTTRISGRSLSRSATMRLWGIPFCLNGHEWGPSATGTAEDPLRGTGQRLLIVRRFRGTATDL